MTKPIHSRALQPPVRALRRERHGRSRAQSTDKTVRDRHHHVRPDVAHRCRFHERLFDSWSRAEDLSARTTEAAAARDRRQNSSPGLVSSRRKRTRPAFGWKCWSTRGPWRRKRIERYLDGADQIVRIDATTRSWGAISRR